MSFIFPSGIESHPWLFKGLLHKVPLVKKLSLLNNCVVQLVTVSAHVSIKHGVFHQKLFSLVYLLWTKGLVDFHPAFAS